jgi:hypothetical protein
MTAIPKPVFETIACFRSGSWRVLKRLYSQEQGPSMQYSELDTGIRDHFSLLFGILAICWKA